MAIKEKGYSRWQGELVHLPFHWLPMFFNGIRSVWKRKYSKLTFFFSLMPFFIFLVAIYAISKPELKMFVQLVRELRSDALIFNKFYTNGFLVFMMMILAIFSGSELISADLRVRALSLYFSRPLTKIDYLVGKFSIVLFYLLLFTLVPGFLLFLFKIIFSGSISFAPRMLLAIITFPLIAGVFLAAMTLGFSILSANTRLIRILIIIIFIFSDSIAETLAHILNSDYFFLLSIPKNFTQLGYLLFGTGDRWHYPPWISLASILFLTLFFCTILYLRIRKVEAQS